MTAQAHFVAFAKVICREVQGEDRSEPDYAGFRAKGARLRALMLSAHKAPRVATLISDLAAQQRVHAALDKAIGKRSSRAFFGDAASTLTRLLKESYRSEVKRYADEKALGIACIGRPPRKPIEG